MVSATVLWLADTVRTNLALRGIASGFGFLFTEAGFNIIQRPIHYDEQSSYARAFLVAFINMLLLAGTATVLATVLGVLVGGARIARNRLLSWVALGYVELIRNVPILLQILFWYYAVLQPLSDPRNSLNIFDVAFLNNRGLYLPAPVFEWDARAVLAALGIAIAIIALLLQRERSRRKAGKERGLPVLPVALILLVGCPILGGFLSDPEVRWDVPRLRGFNFSGGLVLLPEFVALVIAISIYNAAFIAEIVRAGLQSIDRGQIEAADALGLTPVRRFLLIELPQATRLMVPPLTSQYLNLIKGTSLGAAIAYPEVMQVLAGSALNQTGRAIEVMAIVLAVYLGLSSLIALFLNWYNRRVMRWNGA